MPGNPIAAHRRVLMIRRDLVEVPVFAVPKGYQLRWYQPGDETHWLNIHLAAEHHEPVNGELFLRRFGTDPAVLGQRQVFLLAPTGQPVGTATAWQDPSFQGQSFGRVHYVAVIPEYQGRGLSKPLVTAVLLRLKELGHTQAYLATATARLPAINLYLQFGFQPLMRDAGEEALWAAVLRALNAPGSGKVGPARHP